MREIEATNKPVHPLNFKVKVELTLEEIAIINAVLGAENNDGIIAKMKNKGFDVNYNNTNDKPYELYEDARAILNKHGY